MKSKGIAIVLLCCGFLVAFAAYIYYYEDKSLTDIVFAVASLLGIYGLLYNFKRERDLAEAKFIFDLYKAFRSNEKIVNLYTKLEMYYLGKEVEINEEDRKGIVEYLVFMENLASLVQRNVITLKRIDPIFGFDFFIAAHNPAVQELELLPYRDYYVGTYKLYRLWLKHREKRKLPIPIESELLDK